MTSYAKPLPIIDDIAAPYWEFNRRHEFRLQKCSMCGAVRYPPKEICPNCLDPRATWELMSGRGTVWSWIEMYQPYFVGFRNELPYVILWVELEEGPMIMTNLVDSDRVQLRCGSPVEVTFVSATPEIHLPQFRLRADGSRVS